MLAPGIGTDQASALAERIRAAVCERALEVSATVQVYLTVSIGVASITVPREPVDLKEVAEHLLSNADAALYRAKQLGRNRVEAG